MTPTEKRGLEFEALVCDVSALAIEVEGMKVANKEREYRGEALAYPENSFIDCARVMRLFAQKFRNMR